MMGNLNADEIEDVLRKEVIGRLAYIADGWPHVVPVTYAYDGEFLFSHSAPGHKIEAMRKSPQVGFEVEDIRSIASWRTVLVRGVYEELSSDAEERAMDLLARKSAWAPPGVVPPDRREDVHRREGIVRPILFRIRLLERFGRFELT